MLKATFKSRRGSHCRNSEKKTAFPRNIYWNRTISFCVMAKQLFSKWRSPHIWLRV